MLYFNRKLKTLKISFQTTHYNNHVFKLICSFCVLSGQQFLSQRFTYGHVIIVRVGNCLEVKVVSKLLNTLMKISSNLFCHRNNLNSWRWFVFLSLTLKECWTKYHGMCLVNAHGRYISYEPWSYHVMICKFNTLLMLINLYFFGVCCYRPLEKRNVHRQKQTNIFLSLLLEWLFFKCCS